MAPERLSRTSPPCLLGRVLHHRAASVLFLRICFNHYSPSGYLVKAGPRCIGKRRRAGLFNVKDLCNLIFSFGRHNVAKSSWFKEWGNHYRKPPITFNPNTAPPHFSRFINHFTHFPWPRYQLDHPLNRPHHPEPNHNNFSLIQSHQYPTPYSFQTHSIFPTNTFPHSCHVMDEEFTNLLNDLSLTEPEACIVKADSDKLINPINALVGRLAIRKFASIYDMEKWLHSAWDVKTPLEVITYTCSS